MRALIIDDVARADVVRVLAHAAEHHYRPAPSARPPGDDDGLIANLGTYRCVFSFTHVDGIIWRHITISVPGKDYASPAAAFMIADLFGFTGYDEKSPSRPGSDWQAGVNEHDHCVAILQPVERESALNG